MTAFEATLTGGEVIVTDGPTPRHHSIPGLTVFGIEQGLIGLETLTQAARVAALPFVGPFMALMPDAHYGMGATIGSVIPTRGVVMPSAVGTDIGCGVYALQTDITTDTVNANALELLQALRAAVPLGSGNQWAEEKLPEVAQKALDTIPWSESQANISSARVMDQMGTLGGGNHFIELAADEEDMVWLLIHSGSRGSGARIADHHIKAAQASAKRWWIELQDPHLAYLPTDSEQGQAYLSDMAWAKDYAQVNRSVMGILLLEAIQEVIGSVSILDDLDTPHNYARMEQVGKHPALVTRKGAISAREGERGIIPGSMGTPTYLVSGRGNMKGLQSAPHGAGRPRSRTASRKMIDMQELQATTQGVHMIHEDAIRDEAPGAYKNVEEVILAAQELITIDQVLRPLINVKGGK